MRGTLFGAGGAGLPDVLVAIRETGQSTSTDKHGVYVFPKVAEGTYVLVATAAGYQPLHITDVMVGAGRDLALGKEEMRKAAGDVTNLEPFVVHADAVTELEKYEVAGLKEKPFATGNVDIPRTIDDAQPYVIFEAKSIERSGSVNVEDFLKQQLTMNASPVRTGVGTGGGITVTGASNSTIDLRGIGSDKTLILVNGRRQMTTGIFGSTAQPDLNLIPMGLIERIEVLPSSASGIYGGSAIGGVVNVILKRNFSGGEVRVNYASPMDTDAPTATVAANYGLSLEGGRTQVQLGVSWSDGKELTLGERRDIYLTNLDRILANFPGYFNNISYSFASERPNITPTSIAQTTLTLKNGTVLNTPRTFVGPGIGPGTPASQVYASLAANAGQFGRGMADTNDLYNAGASLGVVPRNTTYTVKVRREMLPWLEVFSDFSYTDQFIQSVYNPFGDLALRVPADAVTNPFTTAVWVRAPSKVAAPIRRESLTRALTLGALLKLPAGWTAELDYTWSGASARYFYSLADSTTLAADLASGALKPVCRYRALSAFSGPLSGVGELVPDLWAR